MTRQRQGHDIAAAELKYGRRRTEDGGSRTRRERGGSSPSLLDNISDIGGDGAQGKDTEQYHN